MIYTDFPTSEEFRVLDNIRGEICVSIYLPTTPVTTNTAGDRTLFKNLVNDALEQLKENEVNKRALSAVATRLDELYDDDSFWAYLADGLGVLASPKGLRTYRLPFAPETVSQVSDRFHLKPLIPLIAFPNACYVLALSSGAVRLVEVTSGLAKSVKIRGLPKNMSDAVKRQLPRDRAPRRRLQGSEGMKVLMGQYCRILDRALRPLLSGQVVPLILAAVTELAAIYRANNSYPHLSESVIRGNPEQLSNEDLADKARKVVSRQNRKNVLERLRQITERSRRDLASSDLAQIARAAIRGQISTLLVDPGASLPGTINPKSGKVTLAKRSSANSYDVLDELAGLTIRTGGELLPVESAQLPGDSPVAAIFRYRG